MDITQFLNQINPIIILSVVGSFALLLLIIGVVISIVSDRQVAVADHIIGVQRIPAGLPVRKAPESSAKGGEKDGFQLIIF